MSKTEDRDPFALGGRHQCDLVPRFRPVEAEGRIATMAPTEGPRPDGAPKVTAAPTFVDAGLGPAGRLLRERRESGGELAWQLISNISLTPPKTLADVAVKLRLLCDEVVGAPAGVSYEDLASLRQVLAFIERQVIAVPPSPEVALRPSEQPGGYDVLYVDHGYMAPEIPPGSIAFLDPPGFSGDAVYSVPYDRQHLGNLRRISGNGTGYLLQLDNWPPHDPPLVIGKADLDGLGVRRVAGLTRPMTSSFGEFIRSLMSTGGAQ